MGKRYAINIGVSTLDKGHYKEQPPFKPAEYCAEYLQKVFTEMGFTDSKYIPSQKAVKELIIQELKKLRKKMIKEDLLVLSFCGHTLQISDAYDLTNSQNRDEGWALYDSVLFHFEIWKIIKKFKSGVRIIIITDSCYSDDLGFDLSKLENCNKSNQAGVMPSFLKKNAEYYNEIMRGSGKPAHSKVKPSVVILSSSSEYEEIGSDVTRKRTYFSLAFEKTWELKKNRDESLVTFFDALTWNLNIVSAAQMGVYSLDHITETRKNVSPKWHYHVGAKYTGLRSQKPIFKNKNL